MRVAGYAALFGRRDRGGDIVVAGAFAESLKRVHASGTALPLLWQHDPGQPIGLVEMAAEDARGLRVIARLSPRAGLAARARGALRSGTVAGLSFGYRVVRAHADGDTRRLERLDIVEVSVVTHPMQPLARVHAVEDS